MQIKMRAWRWQRYCRSLSLQKDDWSLNYLTHTRRDIMFSISMLSRHMHSPTKQYLGATKRVPHYVAGTIDFGIDTSKMHISSWQDNVSDWVRSINNRKSTFENVINLGYGAISWNSKKQDVVAWSSWKAEYVVVTSATCQALWLRRI